MKKYTFLITVNDVELDSIGCKFFDFINIKREGM